MQAEAGNLINHRICGQFGFVFKNKVSLLVDRRSEATQKTPASEKTPAFEV